MNDMIFLNLGSTMCDKTSTKQRELKLYARLEGLNWYQLRRRKKK